MDQFHMLQLDFSLPIHFMHSRKKKLNEYHSSVNVGCMLPIHSTFFQECAALLHRITIAWRYLCIDIQLHGMLPWADLDENRKTFMLFKHIVCFHRVCPSSTVLTLVHMDVLDLLTVWWIVDLFSN